MSKTISYKVQLDTGESIKSLKGLEQNLEKYNQQLKEAEVGSDAFNQAQKNVRLLNKEIETLNQQVEGFTAEKKFQAADGAIKLAAGSLQSFVGGLGLLGIESEALGEFEQKAASAIAVGIGLKDLSEGVGQLAPLFKQSGIAAKLFGTTARTALAASGIGLLVVALGAVVAYWDDITEAIGGASREQKDLLSTQEQSLAASQAQYDIISESENILKLQGKSEREIRQLKIDQLTITAETLSAQLKTQEEIKKAQVETAERNKTIAQNIIRLISLPITVALKGIDLITKKLSQLGIISEATNLEEQFSGGLAGLIFNPEKVEEKGNETIEETEAQLRKTQNLIAGFRLQNQAEDDRARKEANDKVKADNQKAADERQKIQEQADRILLETQLSSLDERNRALKERELQYQEELKVLKAAGVEDLTEFERQYRQDLLDINKEYDDLDAQRIKDNNDKVLAEQSKKRQDELAFLQADFNLRQQLGALSFQSELDIFDKQRELQRQELVANEATATELLTFDKETAAARLQIEQAQQDAKLGIVSNALGSVAEAVGKATAAGKALSIAQAVIDTYAGANKALATYPPPFGQIAAGTVILGGLMNVKKILSTKLPAAPNTSSPTGGTPVPSVPNSSVQIPTTPTTGITVEEQAAIQQVAQGPQVIEAYVLEGNVTSAQEASSKIRQRRRVGA